MIYTFKYRTKGSNVDFNFDHYGGGIFVSFDNLNSLHNRISTLNWAECIVLDMTDIWKPEQHRKLEGY